MSTELQRTTGRRARLTRQGQITVPKAVRDALGARPGDDIEFVPQGDSFLVDVRPRRSVLDFAGIAGAAASRVPSSAEALDEVAEQGLMAAAQEREHRLRIRSRRAP